MPDYEEVSIDPSIDRIENSVRKNGGILKSFGCGFLLPGNSPEKVGDWQIMFVDHRGMGNHGSFVAVATTPETLKIQKRETMRLLREKADAMEARAKLADDEGWPCPGVTPSKDSNDFGHQNYLELAARRSFRERGDFACEVIPLLSSPAFERKGCFLFADDKWAYFAHSHQNHVRVGDGRHRLWVRPVGRRK